MLCKIYMYIFIYLYKAVAYIYKKITGWILYKMHRELRVKVGLGVFTGG